MNYYESKITSTGKLKAEIKAKRSMKLQTKKRINKVSKRQREKLAWRAKRKRDLWEADVIVTDPPIRGTLKLHRFCGLCRIWIDHFEDCELDHKVPSRRGGDTDENTHLTHTLGNRAKGSTNLEAYLAKYSLAERQAICKGEK